MSHPCLNPYFPTPASIVLVSASIVLIVNAFIYYQIHSWRAELYSIAVEAVGAITWIVSLVIFSFVDLYDCDTPTAKMVPIIIGSLGVASVVYFVVLAAFEKERVKFEVIPQTPKLPEKNEEKSKGSDV